MTVRDDVPDYYGRLIRPLRPREIEGAEGEWHSRWLLKLARRPSDRELVEMRSRLLIIESVSDVEVIDLGDDELRLELVSPMHPIDPESYPMLDQVLARIDHWLGVVDINGSPRNQWRTFRDGPSGSGLTPGLGK